MHLLHLEHIHDLNQAANGGLPIRNAHTQTHRRANKLLWQKRENYKCNRTGTYTHTNQTITIPTLNRIKEIETKKYWKIHKNKM